MELRQCAQVPGYNRFGDVNQGESDAVFSRENGKDTPFVFLFNYFTYFIILPLAKHSVFFVYRSMIIQYITIRSSGVSKSIQAVKGKQSMDGLYIARCQLAAVRLNFPSHIYRSAKCRHTVGILQVFTI